MEAKEITAKDLRIGNLVYYTDCAGEDFVGEVDEIKLRGRAYCKGWKAEKPIPLSEEWLVRLGFEKVFDDNADKFVFTNGQFQYELEKGKVHFSVTNDDYFFDDICRVKYVHELQNLVKALTQTELTIKD